MTMDYYYMREIESKQVNDRSKAPAAPLLRRVWVAGPVIVGAGPSGLAAAACLKERGVPSLIVERADCIASLWQLKTYDRLKLHLPKHFCELPLMPFPPDFPTYPTKQQFVEYLKAYAQRFDLKPAFNRTVESARFDHRSGLWSVRTAAAREAGEGEVVEYLSQWLVVATGENAEQVVPEIEGMGDFGGEIVHTSAYKSGEMFRGKRVLVVGCGNSGMEVCLDLFNYNARPSLVVRDSIHVLPQEMFGRSTFGLSMLLQKWFPLWLVDWFLLLVSRFILGDTAKYGLTRPEIGPLQLKSISGKTPVLDVGTLAKIKTGDIKVCKGIKRLSHHTVEFVDGKIENFDAIILATGYKSNVMTWLNLKETKLRGEKDEEGLAMAGKTSLKGWKIVGGEERQGLYAVGFTQRGLLGASADAKMIAQDIEQSWKADPTTHNYFNLMPFSTIISSPSSSSPTTRPPTL